MTTTEVFVQQFARLFVHYRETLTPGQDSTIGTRLVKWNEISPAERERMVAAARLALTEIEDTSARHDPRRYFARPGEAEWGC